MAKPLNSFRDVQEDKVKIDGKSADDPEIELLAAKKILQFKLARDFWEPLLSRGKTLFGRFNGDILTEEQVATYEDVEGKYVLQPPIAKAPIRALVGQAIKSRKSGTITVEGADPENHGQVAAEVAVINAVMKDMELKTKEYVKIRDAIHDTFVSCVPNVLYFDKVGPGCGDGSGKLKMQHLPWDSVLLGPPLINEPDYSDAREMFWYQLKTQADLEMNYPDMVDQIREHLDTESDSQALSSLAQWEGVETADALDSIRSIADGSLSNWAGAMGYVPTVQHLFPIRRKEEVWLDVFDLDGIEPIMRPPEWDDKRWNKWLEANASRYSGPYERTVTTLWMTVFTMSGLVLANKKHWFQYGGRLPASIWIGDIISGKPSGPMADMSDRVLANCVAQIEFLDDVRKGTGQLLVAREGSITNIESLAEEASKSFGIALLSKNFMGPVSDAVHTIERRPPEVWQQYAEYQRQGMYDDTRINESMQGGSAPRQAAVAKNLEITQALIVNAIYLDNVNLCWQNHQNIKLLMIPHGYDEQDVIDIFDEETKERKTVAVNTPTEWDQEGHPVTMVNDITSHEYRWKINPVDDSPTAKLQKMEEAVLVINSAAGPLMQADPSGKFFARFLSALDNEFLQKAGQQMLKDMNEPNPAAQAEQQQTLLKAQAVLAKAQADLIKAQKQGVSVAVTGEDLASYPQIAGQVMQFQGAMNQMAQQAVAQAMASSQPQQQQPGPEQAAPEGQPAPAPAEAAMPPKAGVPA